MNWLLCSECMAQYGHSNMWPDWLRELARDEDRKRKRADRQKLVQLPYFDDELVLGDFFNDRYPSEMGLGKAFEVCEEMGVDWESYDWDT